MKGQSERDNENMSNNSDEFMQIGQLKLQMAPRDLCPSYESKQLLPFVEEIYGMRFEEEPNYSKLNFLLAKILMNHN